jgi:hypothetical protein
MEEIYGRRRLYREPTVLCGFAEAKAFRCLNNVTNKDLLTRIPIFPLFGPVGNWRRSVFREKVKGQFEDPQYSQALYTYRQLALFSFDY